MNVGVAVVVVGAVLAIISVGILIPRRRVIWWTLYKTDTYLAWALAAGGLLIIAGMIIEATGAKMPFK